MTKCYLGHEQNPSKLKDLLFLSITDNYSTFPSLRWMQAEAHWYLRQNHLPPMAEGQQVEDPPMLVGQELALLRHPLGHHQGHKSDLHRYFRSTVLLR